VRGLVQCSATEPTSSSATSQEDGYIEVGYHLNRGFSTIIVPRQVELKKPLGLVFGRGNDSGAYVIINDPKLGNTDERIQVCSFSVFGDYVIRA